MRSRPCPSFRSTGAGAWARCCSTRLHEALRQQGAEDFILGALAGNADAIRLYERHGYRPTWLYLSRLAGRGDPTDTRTGQRRTG